MPDWSKEILLALIAAATGGIAWLFTTQRKTIDKLEERNEALRGRVESLLMDAFARERESNALRVERLALDKQRLEMDTKMAALGTMMAAALERDNSK